MKGNTGLRVNMLTSLTNFAIIVICDVDPLPAVAIINKKNITTAYLYQLMSKTS